MRIKPSKQTMVVFAVVAFLLFGICGYTYYNRASKLSLLDAEIKTKESRLADSEKIARQLTEVEYQYQKAQIDLGILEKGVSTRAYVPTLLRQVEDLGRKNNLRVVGVKPQAVVDNPAPVQAPPADAEGGKTGDKAAAPPPKKPDPYDKISIELSMTGKYWDTVKFIEAITQFPKIIAVDSIQITPAGTVDKIISPELTVRLNTTAFVLKEPKAKKPADEKKTVAKLVEVENEN